MCATRFATMPAGTNPGSHPAEPQRLYPRQQGARRHGGGEAVLGRSRTSADRATALQRRPGLAHRFQRVIHVVDSTTIQWIASRMDWAKHRRRKAAAKCHLRLDRQSLLPRFAIVDTARARVVCAGIRSGEIVIFDRAYVDIAHLFGLLLRDVFWITRIKDNLRLRMVKKRIRQPDGLILADDEVVLVTASSRGECFRIQRNGKPKTLSLVRCEAHSM